MSKERRTKKGTVTYQLQVPWVRLHQRTANDDTGAPDLTAVFTRFVVSLSDSSADAINMSPTTWLLSPNHHIGRVQAIRGMNCQQWYSATMAARFTPWPSGTESPGSPRRSPYSPTSWHPNSMGLASW